MWIPEGKVDNGCDLYHKAAAREISGPKQEVV